MDLETCSLFTIEPSLLLESSRKRLECAKFVPNNEKELSLTSMALSNFRASFLSSSKVEPAISFFFELNGFGRSGPSVPLSCVGSWRSWKDSAEKEFCATEEEEQRYSR